MLTVLLPRIASLAVLAVAAAGVSLSTTSAASDGLPPTPGEAVQPPAGSLANKPAVMLANSYADGLAVGDYWVSEKLDGVRARWNGRQLISRGGKVFAAPRWFVANFPPVALDGELWSQRGDYQLIASITARQTPHDGWRALRFMAFDMPQHGGTFGQRLAALRALPAAAFFAVVPQRRFVNEQQLMQALDEVMARGGEGLMLHAANARYTAGRSAKLLKLKRFSDAEAVVVGYRPGKGKYRGLIGALKVKAGDKTFYLGSGLSDAERRLPPPIGSLVTYRYQGFTNSGLPRFAVFVRQRAELDAQP